MDSTIGRLRIERFGGFGLPSSMIKTVGDSTANALDAADRLTREAGLRLFSSDNHATLPKRWIQ